MSFFVFFLTGEEGVWYGTRRSARATLSSSIFFFFLCVFAFFPRTAHCWHSVCGPADRNISGGEKGADREISGEAGEGRRARKCERSGMTVSEIETQTFAEPRVPPLRPPMGGGDRREAELSAAWRSGLLLVKY